jgi:hypothetical protein
VTRAPTSGTAQELIRASQRLGEGGFNPLNSLENKVAAARQRKDSSLAAWTRSPMQ